MITDELLNRAFKLAFFIQRDKTTALEITITAADKLQAASTSQNKRRYYKPAGRTASLVRRNKIVLNRAHLLQRLVYIESESYERIREQRAELLSQADLGVHFIKHLVKITMRRNSFYVTLGLCRLLYHYTTPETAEVFNWIIQDPDRFKDDEYYRARKKHLMQELRNRFGDMLRTNRGVRGEERFQARKDSEAYSELVQNCLSWFTPWDTKCVLPAGVASPAGASTAPTFSAGKHHEEQAMELNRIHTILHPDCYRRLVIGLGFAPPEQRLEVPYFFTSSEDSRPPDRHDEPPDLHEEELSHIKDRLIDRGTRRTKFSGNLFIISVDGVERGRFDLSRTNTYSLEVQPDSDLVEVWGLEANGKTLLATCFLPYDESGVLPSAFTATLGAGRALSFDVVNHLHSAGDPPAASITITYRKYGPVRTAASIIRDIASQAFPRLPERIWTGSAVLPLVSTLGILLLVTLGLLFYMRATRPPSSPVAEGRQQNAASDDQESPLSTAPPSSKPPGEAAPARQPELRRQPTPPRASRSNNGQGETVRSPRENAPVETDVLRDPRPIASANSLPEVKFIHVDPLGTGRWSRELRGKLIQELRASGRFVFVKRRNQADALVKGYVKKSASAVESTSVVIQLVNANGDVLWPRSPGGDGNLYSGTASEAASQIVKALLDEIRRLEMNR